MEMGLSPVGAAVELLSMMVPGGAGEGELRRRPGGLWKTGGAALLHRQFCLCCYGEDAVAMLLAEEL